MVRQPPTSTLSLHDALPILTRGSHSLEGAMWSAVPLTDLGTPTFVLRDGDNAYVAQFRHRGGSPHAHITFFAPAAELCTDRSEEHTSELQSHSDLVCRLLLE